MRIHNKPSFRNTYAKEHFEKLSKNSDVYECGVDGYNRIYFSLLNGEIIRYTRREFLRNAKRANFEIY